MDEQSQNSPFEVTRHAGIGYAIYYAFFRPSGMSWWLVIAGGIVVLCITAALDLRIMRRRQRDRDDQSPA